MEIEPAPFQSEKKLIVDLPSGVTGSRINAELTSAPCPAALFEA